MRSEKILLSTDGYYHEHWMGPELGAHFPHYPKEISAHTIHFVHEMRGTP